MFVCYWHVQIDEPNVAYIELKHNQIRLLSCGRDSLLQIQHFGPACSITHLILFGFCAHQRICRFLKWVLFCHTMFCLRVNSCMLIQLIKNLSVCICQNNNCICNMQWLIVPLKLGQQKCRLILNKGQWLSFLCEGPVFLLL